MAFNPTINATSISQNEPSPLFSGGSWESATPDDEEIGDGLTKDASFRKNRRRACWNKCCCFLPFSLCCCKMLLSPGSGHRNQDSDDGMNHIATPLNAANVNDDDTQELSWERVKKQGRTFVQLSLPYFQESVQSRWLLLAVIIMAFVNSGTSVLFSYVMKDFWNALSDKNVEEFYKVMVKYAGTLALCAPAWPFYFYTQQQLSVHWREWMTARTYELYSSNQVYYKLERLQIKKDKQPDDDSGPKTMMSETIDNPDQRIAEDIKNFTSFSISFGITVMRSMIDLVSFSAILWSISPRLFVTSIAYALFGTIMTVCIGKPLIGLNFKQLRREADLRYLLVRLRENAESIAFYAGEDLEGQAIEKRAERVMDNQRDINKATRNLEFFTMAYGFLIQVVPVAVVAPDYFAGIIELGVVNQGSGAFSHILTDLSTLIYEFEELSTFFAGIERLSDFYEAMRNVDSQRSNTAPLLQPSYATKSKVSRDTANSPLSDERSTFVQNEEAMNDSSFPQEEEKYGEISLQRWAPAEYEVRGDDTVLMIEKMNLCTPDRKRVLIRNLSLHLRKGENLLIQGASGAGKSSLIRAIAGLWSVGSGEICRPADEEVYFLPQRPYCSIGSLKDQLLYPSVEYAADAVGGRHGNRIVPRLHLLQQELSDQQLLEILERVDLLDIATRSGDGNPARGLYAVEDWSNQLSLGEQQRLSFGRLLVNRPSLVILDEATSALDIHNEQRMYDILGDMSNQPAPLVGFTFVSVGHRPSLVNFHTKLLTLSEEGTCNLAAIKKSAS